jgi:hypothetical protein
MVVSYRSANVFELSARSGLDANSQAKDMPLRSPYGHDRNPHRVRQDDVAATGWQCEALLRTKCRTRPRSIRSTAPRIRDRRGCSAERLAPRLGSRRPTGRITRVSN